MVDVRTKKGWLQVAGQFASGGQGMIPWTPGCGNSCPSFLGVRAATKLFRKLSKDLFIKLFKSLAPGRAAGGNLELNEVRFLDGWFRISQKNKGRIAGGVEMGCMCTNEMVGGVRRRLGLPKHPCVSSESEFLLAGFSAGL